MATSVIMPKAGMAMEDGLIIRWIKNKGDAIVRGDALAEIETDKAAMELEADADGFLLEIVRAEGERVPVTEVIAWIGTAGEAVPAAARATTREDAASSPSSVSPPLPAPSATDGSSKGATPAARRRLAEAGVSLSSVAEGIAGRPLRLGDVESHIRKSATPLASRMAEARGIDVDALSREKGSRVTKSDLVAASIKTAGGMTAPTADDCRIPLSKIQRISGERLSKSHSEIPSVTICMTADITELLECRSRLNAALSVKISLNDFAVRAAAKALIANPRANASVDGDAIVQKGHINVGMAVATDVGLLVPVLFDAGMLSLAEQSSKAKDLAERARTRRLKPHELEGGTFTVTNIGMYGVTSFTPIINQPEAGILGIGAVEDRLVRAKDGSIQDRKALHLSFTFDHRVLDGAESSAFLKAVRDLLESPMLLII